MTHDELADAFKVLLDEMHDQIEAQPDPLRGRARRWARVLHGAADALKELAVDHGLVQPLSGGDPKPLGP